MAEGKVYRCDWREAETGYEAWVVAKPRTRVSAGDFDQCQWALAELITEKFGDIDPVLEFARGYPQALVPSHFNQSWVWLGMNEPGHLAAPVEAFYEGGECRLCRKPQGGRTAAPLVVQKIPPSDCLNIGSIAAAIYSEPLLEALGVTSGPEFHLRKIDSVTPSRRILFEVLPKRAELVMQTVAVKEIAANPNASECSICGRKSIFYRKDDEILEFVSAAAVDAAKSPILLFKGRLCLAAQRWQRLSQARNYRYVYARPMICVEERDIDHGFTFPVVREDPKRAKRRRLFGA